jgi:hypothetical protein
MLHTTQYSTAAVDIRDGWGACFVCVGGWMSGVYALATVASLYSLHERTAVAVTHSTVRQTAHRLYTSWRPLIGTMGSTELHIPEYDIKMYLEETPDKGTHTPS